MRECPYFILRLADENGADITCGYLTVLEDRGDTESGRQIDLFIVRIGARQSAGNAPLVYLAGGPGSSISDRFVGYLQSVLHQEYEIIAIDQRGAGFSRPTLNCHEADGQTRVSSGVWIPKCHQRLVQEHIALDTYNSANSANDIYDLLLTLELEKANVYGVSYGSRLALTLARDYPQRVRALILDGVLPPQVNRLEEHALNGNSAFERLFDGCAAITECRRAYPDLRETFFDVIRALNETPAKIETDDRDFLEIIDGDNLVFSFFDNLYYNNLIPYLPAYFDSFAQGIYTFDPAKKADEQRNRERFESQDPQPIESDLVAMEILQITDMEDLLNFYRRLSDDEVDAFAQQLALHMNYKSFQEYLGLDSLDEAKQYMEKLEDEERERVELEVRGWHDTFSEGTWLSFRCADEVPFNSLEAIVNRPAHLPVAVRKPLVQWAKGDIAKCDTWDVPASSPIENQPVASDIPTLLLSGHFDPVTPPEWGHEAGRHLTYSWHYVFPDAGHGVLFESDAECAESIALSFLANPEIQPDAACISDLTLPAFYIRP